MHSFAETFGGEDSPYRNAREFRERHFIELLKARRDGE